MLAVHWAPVSKTKNILKNGIRKSKNGLYCFPLTGHKWLDRWWIYFFNQCRARQRKKYNGFIFRIKQQDLPAYFGHWIFHNNACQEVDMEITTLKQLGIEFREAIMWRLGEILARTHKLDTFRMSGKELGDLYLGLAKQELEKSPNVVLDKLNDLDFMRFTLEDYQIVLSNPIPANRIIKVIPQGDEFGRVLRLKKKTKLPESE